jgi:ectoine hydroxylase-related dioxygenase (phytanoyl-CoA dioxygenase family)
MTSWLALSAATAEMGAPRFIRGSHRQGIVHHRDVSARDPACCGWRVVRLADSEGVRPSSGGEWGIEESPIDGALQAEVESTGRSDHIITVDYRPGDVSFHHGRMIHESGANRSPTHDRYGLSMHLWPQPNEAATVGGGAAEGAAEEDAFASRSTSSALHNRLRRTS